MLDEFSDGEPRGSFFFTFNWVREDTHGGLREVYSGMNIGSTTYARPCAGISVRGNCLFSSHLCLD